MATNQAAAAPPPSLARDGLALRLPGGWTAALAVLPSHHHDGAPTDNGEAVDGILLVSLPLATLYAANVDAHRAMRDDGAGVALADYAARTLSALFPVASEGCRVQTMGQARHGADDATGQRRRRRRKGVGKREAEVPYVLERTDCLVARDDEGDDAERLQFFLHVAFSHANFNSWGGGSMGKLVEEAVGHLLAPLLDLLTQHLTSSRCYAHVACVVLQRRLRGRLQPPKRRGTAPQDSSAMEGREEKKTDGAGSDGDIHAADAADPQQYLDAVAFIADGSLLPRKSGRSSLPMASPPAVPFASPEGSAQLTRVVTVEVGPFWRRFLNDDGSVAASGSCVEDTERMDVTTAPPTSVAMRGMIIPRGVTLIVGGGYHGKSTLLQTLSLGVYDTPPGDGRERCVTHPDAVAVRAEDGRYVHQCNVSAFLSNLPSGRSMNGASIASRQDTTTFSTRDASGSTSQAANVIEALEAGASALLVDEDVSAANFMARDGRMRAMIMDEPITPLLYRVNGLYLSKEHRVSTVVVVGGVGEWLDVADAVVLMKDYRAHDGLEKARSVSYQFSYGHVQYAGKGVVHRLPWEAAKEERIMERYHQLMKGDGNGAADDAMVEDDKEEAKAPTTISPLRRKSDWDCVARKFGDAAIHVPEGGSSRLWFYRDSDDGGAWNANNDDEDDGIVDMSKCSQLVGHASEQLYGCGVCVLWLLRESRRRPEDDLGDLLDRMESALDEGGMKEFVASSKQSKATGAEDKWLAELLSSHAALDLWETVGYAYRPRRHEVAMALTRMRGMEFNILPEKSKISEVSSEEEVKRLEEESRKRALAELWANRRKR